MARCSGAALFLAAAPILWASGDTQGWRAGSAREAVQSSGQDRAQESQLDKLLRVARSGRPAARPQAAARLVALGTPAAERLVAESGATTADLALLGPALIEVLGEFDEPRLRVKLWAGLADRDFPWRPAAARSLAASALPAELARIEALLTDPLAAVRKPAVEALSHLPAEGPARERRVALVRELLVDENDRVRRAAAEALDGWGERWALYWLLEDLRRTDVFFDRPDGMVARYEAKRALERRMGAALGYDPEADPTTPASVEALRALEARVAALAGTERPELPPVARVAAALPPEVLGLELRSCRRGEFFLRWTADDALHVGTGNAARIALAPGTVVALRQRAQRAIAAVGEQRLWGSPGCDLEQVHLRPSPGARVTTLILAKGPDTVEDLRPAPLDDLLRELLATLPEAPSDDPRLSHLRSRTRAALAVLGGPLE